MASKTMNAYWMTAVEGVAQLDIREVPIPTPSATQMLVKLHAASLNRGEFILGHGLHKGSGAKAIGMEGAGEVVALGEELQALSGKGFKLGDRVMGRCAGAFAQYALVDPREAMHVPAHLSYVQAASIPLTYLVAHDCVRLQGKVQSGQWVLINGVSSGVGVAALHIAKAFGAKVIGTSGSLEKLAKLNAQGLDEALYTRAANFHDDVMRATDGKGVDLVVNTLGGSVFAQNIRCLAFEGRHAMVGYVDGQLKAEMDIEALHAKRLTLFGVSNKMRTPEQRASGIPAFKEEVLPLIVAGKITPQVDRTFAFTDLAAAKACMEAGEHLGKIVLTIA